MPFWVYILRCADGSFYVGHTDNLEARYGQHQVGLGADWTARRLPVELAWADHTSSRHEALAFERRLKGWSRAKKLAWFTGDYATLSWLAKPPGERPSHAARPSTSLRANGAQVTPAAGGQSVSSEVEGQAASDLISRRAEL